MNSDPSSSKVLVSRLLKRQRKNASENVICSSRLLHILTNVGKQCGPNSATDSLCKQVGPKSGPTKSRA